MQEPIDFQQLNLQEYTHWSLYHQRTGKLTTWLKEWSTIGLIFIMMVTSITSISAAAIELPRSLEDESNLLLQTTSRGLPEDSISPDILSYGAKALQCLCSLFKSGLKFVREHPAAALTAFLVIQNNQTSIKIPCAAALLVTNGDQNITSNAQVIALLPITFSAGGAYGNEDAVGDVVYTNTATINATIVLGDIHSGNLTSTVSEVNGTEIPQTFSNGVWNAFYYSPFLNLLLSSLVFTRAIGYHNITYLYLTLVFENVAESYTNTQQGIIQIYPLMTTNIPGTSLTDQPSTTINTNINISNNTSTSRTTQVPSMVSSAVTTSLLRFNRTLTNPVTNSNVATIPMPSFAHGTTTNTSTSATSSTPLLSPSNKSIYGIIGGIAGGLVLGSYSILLARVIAIKQGWCGLHKKSSSAEDHPDSLTDESRSNYALIVVAQPQNSIPSEYDDLPAATAMT